MNLKALIPPGIDDLDRQRLGRVQRPGDVVADRVRPGAVLHQPEKQVVIAEQDIGAFVQQRHVGHLLVGLAGVDRQHRRLERHGVAHAGIGVAGGEGRRAGVAAAAAAGAVARLEMGAMLLGQHHPRDVDLAAADMAVHVDPAGHHDLAGELDHLVRPAVGRRRHDAAVLDPQIHHLAVDAVERIVDRAAGELRDHAVSRRAEMLADADRRMSAALGRRVSRSRRSGRLTTPSLR